MAQQVKYPALSLPWLRLLLGCRFDPWPGNFRMLWVWTKQSPKTMWARDRRLKEVSCWNIGLVDLARIKAKRAQ